MYLSHDDPDLFKIKEIKIRGCGCKNKCSSIFSDDTLYSHILNMRQLSKDEKDMNIMGSLVDSCKETTKRGKKRIRSRQTFMFSGEKVCRNTFLLFYGIGKHFLHNIITHYNTYGVTPCKFGNLGKKPSHSLQYDDLRLVASSSLVMQMTLGYHNRLPKKEEMTLLPYTFHPIQRRRTSTRNMLKVVRTTHMCGIPHFATSGTSVFRILE